MEIHLAVARARDYSREYPTELRDRTLKAVRELERTIN
jgi:hypothetical protein